MVKKDNYAKLREKAEKLLHDKGNKITKNHFNDINSLIEELNIYHIELEMQNVELQEANQRIFVERERYKKLYMDAPVAYFTLNETGNILELNHAAANMLKTPIQAFKFTSIFPYLEEESKTQFSKYFKRVFSSEEIEFGEIVFINKHNEKIYAHLSSISYFDEELNQKLIRCTVIDKTKDKQYEKELILRNELEESEKRLRSMFENSGVAMLVIDSETQQIESANSSACEYYGYTSDELKKMKISDLNILSESEINTEIENTKKTGKKYFNFKHKLGNGQIRDVEVYSTAIKFGEKIKLFSLIHDITERKIAEEKIISINAELSNTIEELNATNDDLKTASNIINRERDQLLSLLNSIPEIIYVSDLKTNKILFANNKLKELTGRDITGEPCYEAIQNKEEACSFCSNKYIINSDKPYFWEYYNPIFKKHFYIMNRKINWTNEQEVRFELAIDVTEQKESQLKVELLNNRLEASMSAGDMAWWEMELPSGKIQFNDNKARMLGRNPEDFKHYKDFMVLVHPDDQEMAMQAMRNLLAGKTDKYEIEYRIQKTDNAYLWFYDIGKITSKNGENIKLTGIVTDITLRKETEIALKGKQIEIEKFNKELKDANATKDKFFRIIAHDLKNPFNAIIGYSDLILKKLNSYSKDQISDSVKKIHESSENTYKLLENLLQWSMSQTGKIGFTPKEYNVEEILKEAILQTNNQAMAKNISVDYIIKGNPLVHADENMITTVLRNLISNAIKYTLPFGDITITVSDEENKKKFTISDNGIGMDKSTMNKLFKINEKVTKEGTNKEKGTGLGLLLCKEFVEKHDGKIWAESELNQGSKFIFII